MNRTFQRKQSSSRWCWVVFIPYPSTLIMASLCKLPRTFLQRNKREVFPPQRRRKYPSEYRLYRWHQLWHRKVMYAHTNWQGTKSWRTEKFNNSLPKRGNWEHKSEHFRDHQFIAESLTPSNDSTTEAQAANRVQLFSLNPNYQETQILFSGSIRFCFVQPQDALSTTSFWSPQKQPWEELRLFHVLRISECLPIPLSATRWLHWAACWFLALWPTTSWTEEWPVSQMLCDKQVPPPSCKDLKPTQRLMESF